MTTATATGVPPTEGTHGGGTYSDIEVGDHEGQTSALRAKAGMVLLDYLRATLPDVPETWAGLDRYLGERTARPVGWRGWYDVSAYVLDGGIVACCSDQDRAEVEGVLVDLPGRACACLGDGLVEFLSWCLDRGKVTRADYAIDDTEGRLSFDRIMDANKAGALVTRWQRLNVIENYRVGSGDREGWTVYIGSRSSEAFCRIYDKGAEQARKGAVPAGTPAESWIRFELETKGDFADALAREVRDRGVKGGEAVVEQINRRIRFAVPSEGDTNKRRWATATWWADFIKSVVEGAALTVGEAVEVTVKKLKAWVERQAGPTLAVIVKAAGGDLSDILEIICKGEKRWRSKHKAALALVGAVL